MGDIKVEEVKTGLGPVCVCVCSWERADPDAENLINYVIVNLSKQTNVKQFKPVQQEGTSLERLT